MAPRLGPVLIAPVSLCLSRGGDLLSQVVHEVGELHRICHLKAAWAREGYPALGDDASRPGAHAEDAVGQECRLAQVVCDENDGDRASRMQVADHTPQLLAG